MELKLAGNALNLLQNHIEDKETHNKKKGTKQYLLNLVPIFQLL